MSDPDARRYRVAGLVQGVGFRWTAQRIARSLGITGTVRNLPDGTVELEAHGAAEALERLRQALQTDMPGRVDAVREDPLPHTAPGEAPDDFRVTF